MSEDNYINEQLLKQVSEQQKVSIAQIQAVLKLIEEGGTVPFIARYRKEVTGGLDEEQIRAIYQEWEYGRKLADRKEDIMRLIEEKGKLTEELKEAIIKANKLSELEDIYRPFKEKKKTRATEAKRRGLEPLALYLLSFPVDGDVLEEAKKYVTVDATEEMVKDGLVVKDEADALQGAKDIIAEMVSDDAKFRRWIRNFLQTRGELVSQVKDQAIDEKQVYEMYYDYREPVSSIKLHRVLAINRGEAEKVLKVSISEDTERVIKFLNRRVIENEESISTPYVQEAIEDGYRRLIKPSIEREIRAELKEKAEDQAIKIFAENLKRYLLTPPMKGKVVLGVDPAYRTGCKLAVVDTTGKVLTIDKIYPNQKSKEEVISDERTQREVDKIKPYSKTLLEKQTTTSGEAIPAVKVAMGISPTYKFSLIKSFSYSGKRTLASFTAIIDTFDLLFSGDVGIQNLSGPVGIFSLTKNVASQGIAPILNLTGLLSVNIGLLNLLPIPALDGGRLLFLAYEAITKKKPNQKVEVALITITMLLLFGLMIVVTFGDILRLLGIRG
jgi:transcriptional accessory protein Tex/SPT6